MFKSKTFTELYFSAEYIKVKEDIRIHITCSGYLDVGDTEINNVDMCASGVKAEPNCGNTFFYAASEGWCICEKQGFSCQRLGSNYFIEYRVIDGA